MEGTETNYRSINKMERLIDAISTLSIKLQKTIKIVQSS